MSKKYAFFFGMPLLVAMVFAPVFPSVGDTECTHHEQPWLYSLDQYEKDVIQKERDMKQKRPLWKNFFLVKAIGTVCTKVDRVYQRLFLRYGSFAKKMHLLDQEVERLRRTGPHMNRSTDIIKAIFFQNDIDRLTKDLSTLDHGCHEKSPFVVSLTSYPQRMHAGVTLAALVSLVRSQVKPHAIVLYLSKDQFPDQKIGGPYEQAYQVLQDKGVTVRYVDGDLRAHKKYFYVCDDYPDHAHVTTDDDIYYPPFLLEELHRGAVKNPNARIGGRVLQLVPDLISKKTQKILKSTTSVNRFLCGGFIASPSFRLMPTGSGGVWYPRGALHSIRNLISKHQLQTKYTSNDDECLHSASILCGFPGMNVPLCMPYGFEPLEISIGKVGSCNGLWSQCNGVLISQDGVLGGDILYHEIFSYRFPEYDHKNAYEMMNMVPNPAVLDVLAQQKKNDTPGAHS